MTSHESPVIGLDAVKLHLTGPRRTLLETVRDNEPVTVDQISDLWISAEPDRYQRIAAKVPGMVTQILWRVENLGWIDSDDGQLTLSAAGATVLSLAKAS